MKKYTPWDMSTVKVEQAGDGKVSVVGLSEDQFWSLLSGLGRSVDDSDSQGRADDLALMETLNKQREGIRV